MTPTIPPPDHPDSEFLGSLLHAMAPARGPENHCPHPDQIGGYAEGSLVPAEVGAIEEHLTACEECRSVVAVLCDSQPTSSGRQPDGGFSFRRYAAWVAAAGVVWFVSIIYFTSQGGHRPKPLPDQEAGLVAAARELARARPDLFADFRPLTPAERRETSMSVQRGESTLSCISPRENLLEPPTTLNFTTVEAASSYFGVLHDADGKLVWKSELSEKEGLSGEASLTLERPLSRGRSYLWKIRISGPVGDVSATASFTVLSPARAADARAALACIAEKVRPEIMDLVAAHYAVRAGLLSEADRHLRRAEEITPDDPVVQETRALLRFRRAR